MTREEFAERLRQLVVEAEDEGLETLAIIKVLEDQSDAMQITYET